MIYNKYKKRAWDLVRRKYKPFVDIIDPSVLRDEQAKLIDVLFGVCVVRPNGEIASVISRGNGPALIRKAIENGGTWLWCFDVPKLINFYTKCGFEAVERHSFCVELMPEGWDLKAFGQPDYIKMQLTNS